MNIYIKYTINLHQIRISLFSFINTQICQFRNAITKTFQTFCTIHSELTQTLFYTIKPSKYTNKKCHVKNVQTRNLSKHSGHFFTYL